MPSDRNFHHLWPEFAHRYTIVVAEVNAYLLKNHPGLFAKLIEGFRSSQYQQELFRIGRDKNGKIIGSVVTYRDGVNKPSNHQSSLAADLGIFKGTTYVEEPPEEIWDYYAHCLRAHGLDAGHDWKHPDSPHGEWKESDSATYAAAREWQREQGLR